MDRNGMPFEVRAFEELLKKPNSDLTGLAGFFNSGEVWVVRVPARLDVMGGIADYSGSNVCETVLGRGVLLALQSRTDRTLRIRTMQAGHRRSTTSCRAAAWRATRMCARSASQIRSSTGWRTSAAASSPY
jgi:galactokinase